MTTRKLPAGVQDILPRECKALNEIRDKLARKFAACGFEPVLSAALEYYDTYTKITNAVPQEKLFKMTDTDGKLLVLRPDLTLSIARIAAVKLNGQAARLCYFANKWDMESAGANRNREIYQAGVECLGEEGAFSDAQAIAFAVECLKETGLKNFIVDVGHVGYLKGVLEELGLSPETEEKLCAYINAKDGMNAERLLKNAGVKGDALNTVLALPALFGGAEVLDVAEALTQSGGAREAVAHLKKIYALLTDMGYSEYICFDLGTVKRFSYYSGVVFSALVKELGAAVASGGRYDCLADDFGAHVPAVGFAVGLKRILVALERQGGLPAEDVPDFALVCAQGAEGEGYREYLRLVGTGKTGRLSPLYGEEGITRERPNAKELYFVTKEGVKKL